MPNKKVLLISYHYYPSGISGSIRFSYLSKLLEEKNYEVHVLTIKSDYIESPDDDMLHSKNVHRTKVFPFYNYTPKNVLSRKFKRFLNLYSPIDQYSGWIFPGTFKAISVIRRYKIKKIVVTGPPFSQFFIGYFASIFTKAELYVDYQDPWFLWENYSSFFRKGLRLKKVNLFLEKTILSRAKKIVLNTSVAKDEYVKQFPEFAKKFSFITNAYPVIKDLKSIKLEQNKIVILYAGIFYGERRLSYLLEALSRMRNNNEIKLEEIAIHVFGKILPEDLELIKKLKLEEVVVEHERISYQKVLEYMKGADILYLTQGYDHRHCIPYKLIDYLSVERPVLALTSIHSATDKVMQEVDCGEVAEMTDPDSVYNSLKKIIKKNDYTFKGIEKYSWDSITDNFVQLLEE